MTPKAFPTKAAFVIANPKSKLLDQLREVMRVKHYSLRTEEAYGQWVRRYLKFHRDAAGTWRHPRDLGPADVVAFLNHLANDEHVAAGTQNQALNAISFLYTQVLAVDLGDLGEFLLARSAGLRAAGRIETTWANATPVAVPPVPAGCSPPAPAAGAVVRPVAPGPAASRRADKCHPPPSVALPP